MREPSKKSGAKQESRRSDHKSERQATRAALRGDHVKQPRSSNWGYRPDPVTLPDDAHVVGPRGKSKGKRHYCKRNKGGPHVIGYKNNADWWKSGYYCVKCSKKFWGKPPKSSIPRVVPAEPRPEHWTYMNILNRLAGNKCLCPDCIDSDSDT